MLEAQHITVRPAASGLATTGRKYEKPLLVLFAVVGVVLLISCANIANLMLARNAARHHEIVVRLALGASRARIAWQLFTENLTLSLSGALVAVLLSVWGTRVLVSLLPTSPLPMAFNLQPDFVVVGFTTGVAVATAILFGLGPALGASREKLEMTLHGGQRIIGSTWSGRLLLAGQLALSLPLLVGAGLFVDTLHNLKSSDLGFHAENVVTFDLSYPKGTADDRLHQAYAEIKQRLESHPGDRKSTRLNSSHGYISYAVFCLKKKKQQDTVHPAPSYESHQMLSCFSRYAPAFIMYSTLYVLRSDSLRTSLLRTRLCYRPVS